MFTVKLCLGSKTVITEGFCIEIYPAGKAEGSNSDPTKRTNEVREICVSRTGVNTEEFKECAQCFYVADPHKPRPEGWADNVDFWAVAYIENASGATTEVIRPY